MPMPGLCRGSGPGAKGKARRLEQSIMGLGAEDEVVGVGAEDEVCPVMGRERGNHRDTCGS